MEALLDDTDGLIYGVNRNVPWLQVDDTAIMALSSKWKRCSTRNAVHSLGSGGKQKLQPEGTVLMTPRA